MSLIWLRLKSPAYYIPLFQKNRCILPWCGCRWLRGITARLTRFDSLPYAAPPSFNLILYYCDKGMKSSRFERLKKYGNIIRRSDMEKKKYMHYVQLLSGCGGGMNKSSMYLERSLWQLQRGCRIINQISEWICRENRIPEPVITWQLPLLW